MYILYTINCFILCVLVHTNTQLYFSTVFFFQNTLEQALEEEASELLVKQDVRFDLPLVGSLLNELRTLLMDQLEDYTQPVEVPEVTVTTMDDIASGLTLLRDYVLSKSYAVVKVGGVGKAEVEMELKHCRERVSDLERQVKEGGETRVGLEQQLEVRIKREVEWVRGGDPTHSLLLDRAVV